MGMDIVRSYQLLLFFIFMGKPLWVLLRITMKSNIRPQETYVPGVNSVQEFSIPH